MGPSTRLPPAVRERSGRERSVDIKPAFTFIYFDLKSNYLTSCRDVSIVFTGFLPITVVYAKVLFARLFRPDTVAEKTEKVEFT